MSGGSSPDGRRRPAVLPAARFFSSREELRAWFVAEHARASEVWIGYPKRSSGRPGLSYPEVLEEALCFGWIDGQVRSLGPEAYANRYVPRRDGSPWSLPNITTVCRLKRAGRVHPSGWAAFQRRGAGTEPGTSSDRRLPADLRNRFSGAPSAWAFFSEQPAEYRRAVLRWVRAPRSPGARARRLDLLIDASRRGRRVNLTAP